MAPIGTSNTDRDLILVEEMPNARIIVLNRPEQLNALTYAMVDRLLELYIHLEKDPSVKLIILKGIGRAFCVGGDVGSGLRDIKKGKWTLPFNFFRKDYTLDYLIATYSKPQVSILNGIVMGSGAGLAVHGTFRVATENSVFAMPETALGHFPDAGASYFLSRLPGFFGEYLGLTGSRVDGAEMLACGLATHFVHAEKLSSLEKALYEVNSSDSSIISLIIDTFSQSPTLSSKSSYNRLNIINKCFSQGIVEEIVSTLEEELVSNKDEWISSTIKSLRKSSPTSLKITLRSIRKGRVEGVAKGLVREYRMACHVLKAHISKDLFEGYRALLVDKDKNPKWQPSKLELVTKDMVDRYFSKVDDEDWYDLELPPTSNLPTHTISKL